jgi:acetyl-CoA carboxylase biotin carboxylase subunit
VRSTSTKGALKIAKKIGYPVIIKAVAGGGGQGHAGRPRRRQPGERHIMTARSARRNAAFGNGDVYIERYLDAPRHIEVPDHWPTHHGNGDAAWASATARSSGATRSCSKSRPPVDLRQGAQKRWARPPGSRQGGETTNAGTVEFLYDEKLRDFYFMEMNTRIQVEHPVTEDGHRHRPGQGTDPHRRRRADPF